MRLKYEASSAVASVAIEHPAPRIPSFTGGWNMKEKKDDSATSRSHCDNKQ